MICFEGIDGCGKNTQIKLLSDYFNTKGIYFTVFNFPEYQGPLGDCIKAALQDSDFSPYALQMLFSAERLRQLTNIENCIKSKRIVVVNRYKWSSFIYGTSRGLEESWVRNLEAILPNPDINFLLDIDESTSIQRTGGNDVLERDLALLKECRKNYLKLAHEDDSWIILNGNLPPNKIHNAVKEFICINLNLL